MIHWETMFPGRYLKAAHIGDKEVELTIRAVVREVVPCRSDSGKFKDENKYVIYFEEIAAKAAREGVEEKRLIPNKTNAKIIASIHGDDIEGWVGKKITLIAPIVFAFGRKDPAIRVKEQRR